MPYFEPEYPIETERLLLRPFELGDFDALYGFHGRPDVTRYLLRGPPTEDDFHDVLARKMGETFIGADGAPINLAVVLRETGALVGDVTFWVRSHEHRNAEIGWIFDPAHQGKGYAREASEVLLELAFDQLGMHRVTGRLDARNERSARLLERLGMRREAHFVRNEFIQGEWTDELVYAILVEEWRERSSTG